MTKALNTIFPVGTVVLATPCNGDFNNEFMGTVIGHKNGFVQVRDQDDNVFDCDPSQLSTREDEPEHGDDCCGCGDCRHA